MESPFFNVLTIKYYLWSLARLGPVFTQEKVHTAIEMLLPSHRRHVNSFQRMLLLRRGFTLLALELKRSFSVLTDADPLC